MNPRIHRISLALVSAFVSCTLCLETTRARSGTPPTNRTGAPGHGTCANCHTSSGAGSVSIIAPEQYELTGTISVMVTVTDAAAARWGFSLVARDADNPSVDVGSWAAGTADTQVHGTGGSHASHRNAPFAPSPHTFEVNWTAPATGVGDVTFYVAAVAANGNGSNGSGDNTYVNTLTISELVANNQAPTFSVPGGTVNVPSGIATAITGISVDDVDAGAGNLTVDLTVQNGTLAIDDTVPGGVGVAGITNNGTASVTLEGTLAELNATFGDPNGIIYQSGPFFVGGDTLQLLVNDNGNTGPGGAQTGNGSVSIMVNALTYADWQGQQAFPPGEDGPLDDPDGDGSSNLREFFGGTGPLDLSDVDRPFVRDAPGGIEFVYRRAKAIGGVSEQIDSSDDLSVWSILTPDPADVTVTDLGDAEEVVIAIATPPGSFFVRHSVSIN